YMEVMAARAPQARRTPGVLNHVVAPREPHRAQLRRAGGRAAWGLPIEDVADPAHPRRVLNAAAAAPATGHAVAPIDRDGPPRRPAAGSEDALGTVPVQVRHPAGCERLAPPARLPAELDQPASGAVGPRHLLDDLHGRQRIDLIATQVTRHKHPKQAGPRERP